MSKDNVCKWRYDSDEFSEGYITSCGYFDEIKIYDEIILNYPVNYEGDKITIEGNCPFCKKSIRVIEEEKDE